MTTTQRATAAAMIAAKGQTVTLTARTAGSYDTATASAAITTTDRTAKAVVLPLAHYRKAAGNVVQGDETMLLSALDTAGAALTAPKVDSLVTDANGKVYTLIAVDTLAPAGLGLMFDCVVRGAA